MLLLIKYTKFAKLKKKTKCWQTFHRIEGPGKTLLNLLKLFPFSAYKNKKIKFNSNFDFHYYITVKYKKQIKNYLNIVKRAKKRQLLKLKKTRFRVVNKYFKLLLFLINFLNDSFIILVNNLFYNKTALPFFNKNNNNAKAGNYYYSDYFKAVNYTNYINTSNGNFFKKKNLDFYLLLNNGFFELIGHYNDSILLKFKKKILLYYYNYFQTDFNFNKIFKKLKFLKTGSNFFNNQNFIIFYKLMRFIDFFKAIHLNLANVTKSKNFKNSNRLLRHVKKKNISIAYNNKLILFDNVYTNLNFDVNFIPYFYINNSFSSILNFSWWAVKPNELFINHIRDIKLFENYKSFFFIDFLNFSNIYNYKKKKLLRTPIFYHYNTFYNKKLSYYWYNFNIFDIVSFKFFYRTLRKNSWFLFNYINYKNFYVILKEFQLGFNLYYHIDYKSKILLQKKIDLMVIYERFRFIHNIYIYDKFLKLSKTLRTFYRIYFYKYLYLLLDKWKLINVIPKKKRNLFIRWLKKIQQYLSNTHNNFLKDIIKNFVWKDHKVLNKVIRTKSIWKAKNFLNARQASGSYYHAINTLFLEQLNFFKLRLSTNDTVFDNFLILNDLLSDFNLIIKSDKIKVIKKKPSLSAKKFYELLNKRREARGIFFCKYARMFYNVTNKKSSNKYLAKLSKLLIPLKTYNRLYAIFINNKNKFN